MTPSTIRTCFCAAVAVIAAALADPLVEAASNAGWFGPGRFTDHSSVDVVPALCAGAFLIVLLLAIRTIGLLRYANERPQALLRHSRDALEKGIAPLLPVAFAFQIGVLYGMETAEQYAVYGHALGGSMWLGGPALVSLAAHAVACTLVALAMTWCVRVFAESAVRVIRAIVSGTKPAPRSVTVVLRRCDQRVFSRLAFVLSGIGERAPPLA